MLPLLRAALLVLKHLLLPQAALLFDDTLLPLCRE